jgi:hypothetical protein
MEIKEWKYDSETKWSICWNQKVEAVLLILSWLNSGQKGEGRSYCQGWAALVIVLTRWWTIEAESRRTYQARKEYFWGWEERFGSGRIVRKQRWRLIKH